MAHLTEIKDYEIIERLKKSKGFFILIDEGKDAVTINTHPDLPFLIAGYLAQNDDFRKRVLDEIKAIRSTLN